jgi:exopolysaccharide production protein ExoQ
MPKDLALLLCLAFIVWLFRRDSRMKRDELAASWIPALWFANITTKPISYWLGGGGGSRVEGSPVDAGLHLAIYVAALYVLSRRRVDWSTFIERNKLIIFCFCYFAISALWSEIPVPALKRLSKEFGQILVLLVLFTEKDPVAALKMAFCRAAFVLLPLSVLLIRYYGADGRQYHHYTGAVMYTGVASQKNGLGALAFLSTLGLIWAIVDYRKNSTRQFRWWEMRHITITLVIAIYLLLLSNSKTSLICFSVALVLYWAGWLKVVERNRGAFLAAFSTAVFSFVVMEEYFGVSGLVLEALGRDSTLTDRTVLWDRLVNMKQKPLLGWGFYSFWDTSAGLDITRESKLRSAHNGYLDLYLDGGFVALFLLGLLLISGLVKTGREILAGNKAGFMKFAFVVIGILYNISESSFFRLSGVWFCFLFAILHYPVRRRAQHSSAEISSESSAEARGSGRMAIR